MNLEQLKKQALKNPEVKAEYDNLEDEFKLIHQLLSMRAQAGLTQEQLAKRMHTSKAISAGLSGVILTQVGPR